MRIKRVELTSFKRFTHLIVESIPESARLIVLVGPNGAGKTSFMEALNHYYKYCGYQNIGDSDYLSKGGKDDALDRHKWYEQAAKTVDVDFYGTAFPKRIGQSSIKGHFYFRSAYRNEPDFNIDTMRKQGNPIESVRLESLIQNDQTVSKNYQRLFANTVSRLFDGSNDEKTVKELRDELFGIIQNSTRRVFDDLILSSLGDPLQNGSFYFTKGIVKDFHYKNLSAGEKSAFDLILDIAVQSKYYPDAIYCIDEPETHMHTKLQGRVLRELYELTPEKSQLWVSTHSIGMLQEAEEIEKEHPHTVVFLDFSDRDFDDEQIIYPAHIGKAVLNKFYELAFGDFAKLILPQIIVFCEGNPSGKSRMDYDKTIYTKIFCDTYPNAFFLSGGSCNDIENIEERLGEIMSKLLENATIIKIVDRDDRSEEEIKELRMKGIRVLSRRHIEAYLFDDELIEKLCAKNGQQSKYSECLEKKQEAINNSILRGNPESDIKSARGDIYTSLKKILCLSNCGNTPDTFMRDTMTPLITPDTKVYKQLEKDIFGQLKEIAANGQA